jgi:hypothetical protein
MKKFTDLTSKNENVEITLDTSDNTDNISVEIDMNEIPIKQKDDGFNDSYNVNNLIPEICTAMVLLNNNFLDDLLDGGNKNRYSKNTYQFVLDLKTLMLDPNNRLKFGKFNNSVCIEEDSIFTTKYFEKSDFSIEKDWNTLINARNMARGIIDKILNTGDNEKLTSEQIKAIYWCAPNNKDIKADIVIETVSGVQYPIKLNTNLNINKSSSFSSFASLFLGEHYQKLYGDEYSIKLDMITRNWLKLIYENTKSEYQLIIDKFISADRIDSVTFDNYFNIVHSDENFALLGEYVPSLKSNYKYLYKLVSDIWKNRKNTFSKPHDIYTAWNKFKIQNLNSNTLEHLFTNVLNTYFIHDLSKYNDTTIQCNNEMKKRILVDILDKIDSCESDIYIVSKNGNDLNKIPKRQWFRDNYDAIAVTFDYHTKLIIDNVEDENNNFKVNISVILNDTEIIKTCNKIMFSGGDISNKFTVKTNITLPIIFNHI